MKLKSTLRYAASPELVSLMLVDPAFQEAIGQSIHATECSTVTAPDEITTTYLMPTNDALRLVSGPQQKLTGHLRWTEPLVAGRRRGLLTLTIEHFPATFRADMYLAEADADTTEVAYDAEVKVNIPFLGGKLERKVADATQSILDAGQAIGEAWLVEHGHALPVAV